MTKRLCKEHVGRKVEDVPGVNWRKNFIFARIPSFSGEAITWREPGI